MSTNISNVQKNFFGDVMNDNETEMVMKWQVENPYKLREMLYTSNIIREKYIFTVFNSEI